MLGDARAEFHSPQGPEQMGPPESNLREDCLWQNAWFLPQLLISLSPRLQSTEAITLNNLWSQYFIELYTSKCIFCASLSKWLHRVQKLMTSIIALFTSTEEEEYADLQSREDFTEDIPIVKLWEEKSPRKLTYNWAFKKLLFLLPLRHSLLQHPRTLGCVFASSFCYKVLSI